MVAGYGGRTLLPGGCNYSLDWQRQPQEACVILACSLPVEKIHFQVFRTVVLYGTKFLWGKKIKIK